MRTSRSLTARAWWVLSAAGVLSPGGAAAQEPRPPMQFMDLLHLRTLEGADLSADGRWVVYAAAELDWEKNERYTELYLVSAEGGEPRQMTFTPRASETNPKWSRDGRAFAFTAKRDDKTQLFLLRVDGGEARPLTNHKEGVRNFAFSRDGRWIAYDAAEEEGNWQIYLLAAGGEGPPRALTSHATAIESWTWSPQSNVIFFTARDSVDAARRAARKKGFDVNVVDEPESPRHLWRITVETGAEERLTRGTEYSVRGFEVSSDGLFVAFYGESTDRYAQPFVSHDVYLFDIRRGRIDRLTQNAVGESGLSFSPDGRWLGFVAPDGFEPMRLGRVYLRSTAGGELLKAGGEFPWDAGLDFWAADGKSFYFTTGIGVNTQLFEVRVDRPTPRRLTEWTGVVALEYDEDARRALLRFEDPQRPEDLYLAEVRRLAETRRWVRLTRLNPQVDSFALGAAETVRWTSSDGRTVEGILYLPARYSTTRRYPLVVQIHGGPASAHMNRFPASYTTYAHVLAGKGYAVLQPNYRGSANYGERWQMEIAGDYFRQAFDDILAGVDAVVRRGIAHPDSLAIMGWSAGGHWSNWALTHTDRFKAISSGAGAVNWISLYGQTDVQFTREFYFQGLPYGRWDAYWRVSPLQYIDRARTPTLIHFGEKDERIPMSQGQELHMALQKRGVPTEFIVYPGQPHRLRNFRYRLLKMEADLAWFERWVRGKPGWIDWRALVETLSGKEAAG